MINNIFENTFYKKIYQNIFQIVIKHYCVAIIYFFELKWKLTNFHCIN